MGAAVLTVNKKVVTRACTLHASKIWQLWGGFQLISVYSTDFQKVYITNVLITKWK